MYRKTENEIKIWLFFTWFYSLKLFISVGLRLWSNRPVSYTHLDVYKRQRSVRRKSSPQSISPSTKRIFTPSKSTNTSVFNKKSQSKKMADIERIKDNNGKEKLQNLSIEEQGLSLIHIFPNFWYTGHQMH